MNRIFALALALAVSTMTATELYQLRIDVIEGRAALTAEQVFELQDAIRGVENGDQADSGTDR